MPEPCLLYLSFMLIITMIERNNNKICPQGRHFFLTLCSVRILVSGGIETCLQIFYSCLAHLRCVLVLSSWPRSGSKQEESEMEYFWKRLSRTPAHYPPPLSGLMACQRSSEKNRAVASVSVHCGRATPIKAMSYFHTDSWTETMVAGLMGEAVPPLFWNPNIYTDLQGSSTGGTGTLTSIQACRILLMMEIFVWYLGRADCEWSRNFTPHPSKLYSECVLNKIKIKLQIKGGGHYPNTSAG